MSSIAHKVRCAFKDVLKSEGMEGADMLRLSALKVTGEGHDRAVEVSLPGAFVDGRVHLYSNGGYAAVIVSIRTLEGVKWPHTWHNGWLR